MRKVKSNLEQNQRNIDGIIYFQKVHKKFKDNAENYNIEYK